MFYNRKYTVKNKIVSISQSHARSIVRGNTKSPTEFGAKVENPIIIYEIIIYNSILESVKQFHVKIIRLPYVSF